MNSFLKGTQIFLRAIEVEDATEEYASWMNSSEVTAGLVSGSTPSSISHVKKYIENTLNNPNAIMLAICDSESTMHIGNIKIESFDRISNTCELGIMIGNKDFWGKGIAIEACELMIDYTFNILNFRKIELCVFENNPSAKHIYKKLGFSLEGTLRKHVFKNGAYWDKYYMGLLKEEYKK